MGYIARTCTSSTSLCSVDLTQAHVELEPNRTNTVFYKKNPQLVMNIMLERDEVDVVSPKVFGRS